MTLQQNYDFACARAMAAADCAASVHMTLLLGGCVDGGVNNEKAYRDEIRQIAADLTQQAVDLELEAQISKPGFTINQPKETT